VSPGKALILNTGSPWCFVKFCCNCHWTGGAEDVGCQGDDRGKDLKSL